MPDEFTRSTLRPPTSHTDSEASNSFDFVRSGAGTGKKDGRERRHQIPGLQTSPYLKIYVLRCDDKDAYKTTERGKVRQWIRDNASSSSGKKNANQNENHTASEYLILHVVVPDTVAASEPRWRESQREPDELKERKQGAKWPGKSTRTVFDKLRADFNDTSKTDRVAQIRLSKDDVPADLLPTPAQAVTYNETADEQGKTWNDLLTKLKFLILVPFDRRVRQYEQDIAEQESRRSLPGFNFCTFFIHKEGLARALESIGLVEDALVIYDELSLGLESVLRDMANGQAGGTATTFATYTDDVKKRILGSGKEKRNGADHDRNHSRDDSGTVDAGEIDYRERIVRSNISVFDFQCYLFSRRKALILRLANAITARKQLGAHTKEGGEDLVLISEVCWRASNFLHNSARVLRQDLLAASRTGKDELASTDVDALVCSWLYNTAGQILEETATSALEPQSEHTRKESLKSPPDGLVTSPRRSEFSDLGSATAYPQRTTSLATRKPRVSELQNSRASMHSASEETLVSPPPSSATDGTNAASQLPGLPELVTYRAELVMMRRKMLEQLAEQRGWLAGWASLRAKRGQMETVDLNGSPGHASEGDTSDVGKAPSTMLPATLATSLLSEEVFHEAYDRLSDQAMRYYHSAAQVKSAEAIVGDLAILKYQQGDLDFAAQYFEHVLSIYAEEGWQTMEVEALQILRVCFREMGKKHQEIGVLLALIEKQVATRRGVRALLADITEDDLMADVVTLSASLEKELVVPINKIFGDVALEREIVHFDDHDGFALNLDLWHYLDDDLEIEEVVARLVHVDDPNQELHPTSTAFTLKRGHNQVRLDSNVSAFGPYLVATVTMKAENLHFTHEPQPKSEPETTALGIVVDPPKPADAGQAQEWPWMFVYPTQHAFNAEVRLAREVYVDRPRHLEIQLSSGWNEIEGFDLRLKPASAGLRLHLADARLEGVTWREEEESRQGILPLGSFASHHVASIAIPYSLDHTGTRELIVHLSAQYRTAERSSTFLTTARLPAELPLDVDVDDIFHDNALFSNFTVRATSSSPLVISQTTLQPSKVYDAEAPPALGTMTVFEKYPVKLAYKITRKHRSGKTNAKLGKKDAALSLCVQYAVVDELIGQMVKKSFADALNDSPFAAFRRLLCPLAVARTSRLMSSPDVEMAALLGHARMPRYEDMGWPEIISTLPLVVRSELAAWLRRWHEDHTTLNFDLEAASPHQRRNITISVEVPTMDFVHRAAISIVDPLHELEGGDQVLALGEPVNAELTVTSTTIWSSASILDDSESDGQDETGDAEAFIYDVHADPETWLVGGPRRGHLTASNGSKSAIGITLLPLKLGALALPQLDIQPAASSASEDGAGDKSDGIRCDTHCISAGQVVTVIQDRRRTRVQIREGGDEGGHARGGSAGGAPGLQRTAEKAREVG